MSQKILKSGNSLALSIPAEFAKMRGLRPGILVNTTIDYIQGTLLFTFPGTAQLPLISKN